MGITSVYLVITAYYSFLFFDTFEPAAREFAYDIELSDNERVVFVCLRLIFRYVLR